MTHDTGTVQRKKIHGMARTLLMAQEVDDIIRINKKRERFLDFLNIRYGYSNPDSVDEMMRLMKEFIQLNRSFRNTHRHQAFSHPLADLPETKPS